MNSSSKKDNKVFWENLSKQQLLLMRQLLAQETDHEKQLFINGAIKYIEAQIIDKVHETESGRKRLARVVIGVLHWGEHAHFLSVILQHFL